MNGNESLLKRTVVLTLLLVGVSAAWVGLVSVAAVTIADRVVGGEAQAATTKASIPTATVEPSRPKVIPSKPNG